MITRSRDVPAGAGRADPSKPVLHFLYHRIILGLLAVALSLSIAANGSHHVQAASFDCSKAELPLDKLICQTPDLSAKDDQMAVKYKAALAILSLEGQGILRDGQRKWLKFMRTYCTARIGQPANDGGDDALPCLEREYTDRLHQLESAAVQAGDFVFSRVDDFLIWPSAADDDNGVRHGFGYCNIGYPRVDRPLSSETKALNRKLREQAGACQAINHLDDPSVTNSDTNVSFEINIAQSGFIGITLSNWQYDHGAAHGHGGDEQLNFLLPSLRALSVDDIFAANSGWQKIVDERCRAAIAEHLSPEQMAERSDWDEYCNMAGDWIFSTQGVEISIFLADDYYYAAGTATADIPWHDLKPYLRADLPIKLNTE